jgi:competence protein ComEC
MRDQVTYFWKSSPFVRLMIPMAGGILCQHYIEPPIHLTYWLLGISIPILLGFFFAPFFTRFRLSFISGLTASIIFLCIGSLLAYYNDIRNSHNWIGKSLENGDRLVATIDEVPVVKANSIKAMATVSDAWHHSKHIRPNGKIIIYFQKENVEEIHYGTQLIFNTPLQEINRSGNPGAFDYRRYCLLQGITHQVYLKKDDYRVVGLKTGWLKKNIYRLREKILSILRTNISGEKELGLAEALLIGYKDDLDKTLVQSYSSTGVVHIIAISGLHLGLIYWLLLLLLKPLSRKRKFKWLSGLLIIFGLWVFSLLAGAQPSVLRSAVMFTCLVIGETIARKTNIYNTLACSAFMLLCYEPNWIFDVGFQLSYIAVLSIVIFMKPVYNLFFISNKLLDSIWKLIAVTLAAQLLTLPLTIYHFHQFPTYFLLANLVAVPLSSLILLGEILLCSIFLIPKLALFWGQLLAWMIRLMNDWVERMEGLPKSVLDSFQINIMQAILLYGIIGGITLWTFRRSIPGLQLSLVSILLFLIFRSHSFAVANQQKKIIVYNVSQKTAIDFISGRMAVFIGDSMLTIDESLNNFHLKPTRVRYRFTVQKNIPGFVRAGGHIQWNRMRIFLLDKSMSISRATSEKAEIDLLLVSGNPAFSISDLNRVLIVRQIVFDSSVPSWKLSKWKKECDSIGMEYHDVRTKGAFAIKLR